MIKHLASPFRLKADHKQMVKKYTCMHSHEYRGKLDDPIRSAPRWRRSTTGHESH